MEKYISIHYIININVKDTTKPTIYVSQKFIGVDGNANINIEDIIEITTSKYGTFYNIEIENDNEELSLLYDESGTLIKIYANVMPYSWWDSLN